MFTIGDLKQTRVYQDAKQEGRQEGRQYSNLHLSKVQLIERGIGCGAWGVLHRIENRYITLAPIV